MIDMGQAERSLRTRTQPAPWTWDEVKPNLSVVHGDICVIRRSNGAPEVLKIVEQHHSKEWVGCFSFIGVTA